LKRPETIVVWRHWFGRSLRPGKPSNSPRGAEGATMARRVPFPPSSIPAYIEQSMKLFVCLSAPPGPAARTVPPTPHSLGACTAPPPRRRPIPGSPPCITLYNCRPLPAPLARVPLLSSRPESPADPDSTRCCASGVRQAVSAEDLLFAYGLAHAALPAPPHPAAALDDALSRFASGTAGHATAAAVLKDARAHAAAAGPGGAGAPGRGRGT
jgi:hypothetical protein